MIRHFFIFYCMCNFDLVKFTKILGIGRGIAIELWRAGANIVAVSRTKSHLETLQGEYPSIDIVELDIADWDKTRTVIDSLGPFDALVNNAAVAICEPFLECSPNDFDRYVYKFKQA